MSTKELLAQRLQLANNQEHDFDAAEFYDTWAEDYDRDLLEGIEFKQPSYIADEVLALLGDRKDVRILDCGAGTGLAGIEMKKRGFSNIDALDPSPRSLEIAKTKGCYNQTIVSFITPNPTLGIQAGSYDVLTLSGAFGNNHMKPNCLEELRRIVEKDGYIVIGVNSHESVTKWVEDLETALKKYSDEGMLKQVSSNKYPDFKTGWPGNVYVLQATK